MPDKGMTMQDGFGRFLVEYNDMHHIGWRSPTPAAS